MECQPSDSKKLFNVFDASKRKRTKKKCDGFDDSNSAATEDSIGGCQGNVRRVNSAKASLQDMTTAKRVDANLKRELSSPSVTQSPVDVHRNSRSPRRHRRSTREGISLALKAGLVSTPRSVSPQERDGGIENVPRDQDSFIYAFLEDAIKRDKRKQRHARRHEDRNGSRDRGPSVSCQHRHHRRRRDDVPSRDHDEISRSAKEAVPLKPAINETVLFETFAKLCAQMNNNNRNNTAGSPVPRTLSHKSLQCEVVSERDSCNIDRERTRCYDQCQDVEPYRIRSHDNFRNKIRSTEKINDGLKDTCICYHDKDDTKYNNRMGYMRSTVQDEERYGGYQDVRPARFCTDHYKVPDKSYREYERRDGDFDKRRYMEQKTSRSFDAQREKYQDERYRRTARSDNNKHYEDKSRRYDDRDRYYEAKPVETRDHLNHKARRSKKTMERFERNSLASREDDFRERYSERGQDSGLSVADCETSTVSGKSNYLRVVKQEISEQREAMDKMMKLWKELMRCFKGFSQVQGQSKTMNECASNARDSAEAQLQLWRECMRRYETVARDVGDTDARLMEEINKQRSEMAEMSSMWQECLQRYKDISNDFNNLKQQLATSESPTRMPAPPLVCAEGEGSVPPAAGYRLPPNYPPMVPMAGYPNAGSPLRPRASAPPAWWWCGDSPRRRSSPDSRCSRERDRKHRHRDRDEPKYKEKSKPSAARSEHRHKKR